MSELSLKQEAICGYLLAYVTAEQWPPTLREIMTTFGMTTPSTAKYHLSVLERAGLLERGKGSRCIRLTPAGRDVAERYLARRPRTEGAA